MMLRSVLKSPVYAMSMAMTMALLLSGLAVAAEEYSPAEFAGVERCLECHSLVSEHESPHLSGSHSDGNREMQTLGAAEAFRCEACHGPSATHAERQHGAPWILPPVSFSGPDKEPAKAACLECHASEMKELDASAQEFHATARRNELTCSRCHGGVAHGLPDWVVELSQSLEETHE